jgi:putative ABC transport system permease protein
MKMFGWFAGRKQRHQELDEEIRAHLAMAIRERIERGEDPAEAEANARREFGNEALGAAIRKEIHSFDKYLVIDQMRTADSMLEGPESQRRFNAWLLGGFALVALALGAVGIYGVLAYWVSQRTHEIGVRMALGARRGDVLRLVIGQGMSVALMGLGIGIVAALGLTRLMTSLLDGVKPTDPLTFVAVSLILVAVALLASSIPARRATKVDPMVALRHE